MIQLIDHYMNILSSNVLYRGSGRFSLTEDHVSFVRFDGRRDHRRFLTFHRGGSVAVLLIEPATGKICLVEQFRPSTTAFRGTLDPLIGGGGILEIPAGSMDGDESHFDCIRREAAEEVGRKIRNIRKVTNCFLSPGASSEKIFIFLADDDGKADLPGGGLAEEGEDIRIHWVTLDEAMKMIKKGEICDAKTILAIQAYQLEKLGF